MFLYAPILYEHVIKGFFFVFDLILLVVLTRHKDLKE